MVAAESHWDDWSPDYSSVDPSPAVAASGLSRVWSLVSDPVPTLDLDLDYDHFVTAEKTDPSPAVAVTGLTTEKTEPKDRSLVEQKNTAEG